MAQSADELKLPPCLNLRELGLRQLERIKALQQKAHNPAHVAWGTRTKRSVSALITLFSFVSHVTILDHELLPHVMLSDHMIKCFEELNEHYNGTMNYQYRCKFQQSLHLQRSYNPGRHTPIC